MEGQAHTLAAAAAERVDLARTVGAALDLFGLPVPVAEGGEGEARGVGRPAGARNKAKTGLRELMVALGYRDPAQQLAFLAGLNTREDPYLVALGRAEAILASVDGELQDSIERADSLFEKAQTDAQRTIAMRALADAEGRLGQRAERLIGLTLSILKEMRQASDAILPYVFSKLTPDVVDQRTQMLIQMLAPGAGQAAVGAIGARLGPPPMPSTKVEQDQEVSETAPAQSDGSQSDGAVK